MFRLSLIRSLLLTTALLAAAPAIGQDQPILLNANQLIYDENANSVTAQGNVVLVHEGQTLNADELVYDRAADIVHARGHVRIWQSNGDILHATAADLSRDMQQAFVQQVSLLMQDNSRFIALEGERTEGRYVRLNRALYTACDLCQDDPHQPPLWQVRAQRIIHDSARKDVIYRNATLELGGLPVFYTPYLSHPDPSVKRRSGFLAPVIGSRTNLGFTTRTYYYLDVAPSMDATIEASYSAKRGALAGLEWRQKTEKGSINLSSSLTFDSVPNDTFGLPDESTRARGHFFLAATHNLTENWRGSLSIRRTTDDTFLDQWAYTAEDVLTSRGQLEYFTPRSYGQMALTSYQDLRSNITTAEPQVMTLSYQSQSAPHHLIGGRWFLGFDNRAITRSRGVDSARSSLALGWRREDVLPAGVVLTSEATARADGFLATNLNNEDRARLRPFVQGQLTARWPLVRQSTHGQQFIEPIGQLTFAPRRPRDESDIANEDSSGLEFDTTNLFRANRYAGYDRLDGGQRVAYGLRSGWSGHNGTSASAALGQSFDFARRPGFASGTGLETQRSDYVGALNVIWQDYADAAYSFRLDDSNLDPREHDLRLAMGPDWLRGTVNYLYIDQTTTNGTGATLREELALGARYKFTPEWSLSASHRRDLLRSDGALDSSATLTYQDECLTFSLIGQRDHVVRSGLSSGDSIFFRLIFKNLGEFESPSLNPDIFSGTSRN